MSAQTTARWVAANPVEARAIHNRAAAKYRDANREKIIALQRKRKLARRGLTVEDYERRLSEQGGACAICRRPETIRPKGRPTRLAVDHDHGTRKVRGLLCNVCNRALGLFRDSSELLRTAAAYLEVAK
jgi:hypothetical protein